MLYQINGFSYNDTNGLITKESGEFQLTKIQKKLFNYFIQHPHTTLSKQSLMDDVWGRTVTENSIEKTLSKLRNVIEDDPLKPSILVTHFGHGISFEGTVQKSSTQTDEKPSKKSLIAFTVLLVALGMLVWLYYPKKNIYHDGSVPKLNENQRLLILPITFENPNEEQSGINEVIKDTFNNLDSEGQILFDKSDSSRKETIEKHWKIDHNLIMMQTSVKKNGEIYDAVLELSNGLNSIDTVKISAKTLPELANAQIQFIAKIHQGIDANKLITPKQSLLKAQALFKNKNFTKAQTLLEQILKSNDKDYPARFYYAHCLFWLLDYEKSLVQLDALKHTPYYQNNGAAIEILRADINKARGKHKQIIKDLTSYLSSHFEIGNLKKAKIMIQLANANRFIGRNKEALKFFKQAISNLDEKYNPRIYALSYFGQASIASDNSIDTKVYKLFEKALYYAKLSKNIEYQATILDTMSVILFYNNQWKKGLELKRESIALLEIIDDKSEPLGSGLGVLASYLIERGLYSEARNVVNRISNISQEIKSDHLTLIYYYYDSSIELMLHNYEYCEKVINKSLALATKTNNLAMLLNTLFLKMELLLAQKDTLHFKALWDDKIKLFQQLGLERYQIYMDLYLARYYKEIGNKEKTRTLINQVSEQAKQTGDIKFLTDAQNTLAQLYTEEDPQLALDILTAIEQYNPNPNPYLEIKAQVLNKLGKKVEALALMIEAKSAYNEAWKAENQTFLEQLQHSVSQ